MFKLKKCSHITRPGDVDTVINSFKIVHGLFVVGMVESSQELKKRDCICLEESCKNKRTKIHACLFCVYFGCFRDHILNHAKQTGHFAAMDVEVGVVYCFECKDYIFNPVLENIALLQKHVANRKKMLTPAENGTVSKYTSEAISRHFCRVGANNSPNSPPIGVRGIINMGNTCFMNVIFQSLAHAPTIVKFYLSDDHCLKHEMESSVSNEQSNDCATCELGDIVQKIHSGETDPFAPSNFFFKFSKEQSRNNTPFAIGDSGDCQEFFMDLMNWMHSHCKKVGYDDDPCCFMDRMFTGYYKSEITCQECNFSSVPPLVKFNHFPGLNWEEKEGQTATLKECLDRFVRSEEDPYNCEKCKSETKAIHNQTFIRLPNIITIHLHRFEKNQTSKKSRNPIYCNDRVSFDEILDMSNYMAKSPDGISKNGIGTQHLNKFYLFAVITYNSGESKTGVGSGGHYYCYVQRKLNEWYYCTDAEVSKVEKEEVLDSIAYMLFYHRMQ